MFWAVLNAIVCLSSFLGRLGRRFHLQVPLWLRVWQFEWPLPLPLPPAPRLLPVRARECLCADCPTMGVFFVAFTFCQWQLFDSIVRNRSACTLFRLWISPSNCLCVCARMCTRHEWRAHNAHLILPTYSGMPFQYSFTLHAHTHTHTHTHTSLQLCVCDRAKVSIPNMLKLQAKSLSSYNHQSSVLHWACSTPGTLIHSFPAVCNPRQNCCPTSIRQPTRHCSLRLRLGSSRGQPPTPPPPSPTAKPVKPVRSGSRCNKQSIPVQQISPGSFTLPKHRHGLASMSQGTRT